MEQDRKPKSPRARGGEGTKKYPADRNFSPVGDRRRDAKAPAERRDHHDRGSDRRSEKPYGGKTYGAKSYNDRPRERRDTWAPAEDREAPRRDVFPEEHRGYEDVTGPAEGLVIGRNAVRELLRSGRTVDKLLVRRGDREGSIVTLVAEAIEQGIPVVEVDKSKLDSLSDFVPHQGVIAMVAQKDYCTVEDILAIAAQRGEAPFIVIADGITDPYNLGALIRCAEGCGAHGIIIPRRRAVGLTALVAKSSAGAMEHMAIAKVANIHQTVLDLQKAGIWVFAAEAGGAAHYDTNFKGPCALVMGSEGDGVSRVVKETADAVVSIPMYGHVNSFNVSTAAAVILAEIARQHHID
ncbi:MAG: 23S rRNA (guanosine(2251)-2'-O)-methyltransferase RlmB [Clostridia bacterium]|nr:23S rRNA (guanosine(2251)-2'-O)-methyltransferase RlmB [Clostridia bacterium]